MRVQLKVFGSRVARRVFVLFVLASLVPLGVLAGLLLSQVGNTLEDRAYEQLATASRGYGQFVVDKLLSAAAVLSSTAALSPARDAKLTAPGFVSVKRLSAAASAALATAALPDRASGKPGLFLESVAGGPRIMLTEPAGDGVVEGEIDPGYLWTAANGVLADSMNVCIFTGPPRADRFAYCSAPPSPSSIRALAAAAKRSAAGKVAWNEADGASLAAYWELFLPSRFRGQSWYVVVSQPRAEALTSLAVFNRVVPEVVVLSAALIVLLSIAQIRRTLGPLHRLLAGTQRIGERDFAARVELKGDDEFGALGRAMNDMAARLGRQFETLTTLAEIDRLILSAEEIERVLEAVFGRLRTLIPGSEVCVLLLTQDDGHRGGLYGPGADEPEPVQVSAEQRALLASQPGGLIATREEVAARGFHAPGTTPDQTVHLMPILHGGDVAGALITALPAASEESCNALRELAGRLAVAVAAGEREQELFRRAHFDSLTGLPNRQLCYDRLRQAIAQARREEHGLAVLFIDLDGFKNVNDSLGHWAGDELLRETALRLTATVRETDTVSRLGGDEYAVLLPHIAGPLEAEAIAGDIMEVLQRPIVIDGHESFVTASIGVTIFPDDGTSAEELLRKADTAMYNAKDSGRARYVFFAREMDRRVHERHQLHNDLRNALTNDEFSLAYQPQVDCRTGEVVAVEALLRWRHPTRGLVSPRTFVPILEETGLIEAVGGWVLQQALADLRDWHARDVPIRRVAVNVAARQLLSPLFVPFVADVLRSAGLPGECLELELTEATLVEDFHAANVALEQLAAVGIRIAIDDFGTGYSSLGYLNELFFNTLKIDRAFVVNLPSDKSVAIVRAIVAVANALGKSVVAEGIESEPQFHQLAFLGCELAQGYLLSQPLAKVALERWMLERRTWLSTSQADHDAARLLAGSSTGRAG